MSVSVSVTLEDDGNLTFRDADGNPLSASLINSAKRQKGLEIRRLIEETAAKLNAVNESLTQLHHYTPSPDKIEKYQRKEFEEIEPPRPKPKQVGLFAWLFGKRRKIEDENERSLVTYRESLEIWKNNRAAFDAQQTAEEQRFNERLHTDGDFMEAVLENNLSAIIWPRETEISFDISPQLDLVSIDVDLPEVEDFKSKVASVPSRGYKLNLKELKDKDQQKLYAKHIHGVGFRIVGEVFATLPTVQTIALSAYTQRIEPATGNVVDTYVYSVRVPRQRWRTINFSKLEVVDVVEAFERFELRRKIALNGSLESITPFEGSDTTRERETK